MKSAAMRCARAESPSSSPADALDRRSRAIVPRVGVEAHTQHAPCLKRMGQHQQLGLGVRRGSDRCTAQPGIADLAHIRIHPAEARMALRPRPVFNRRRTAFEPITTPIRHAHRGKRQRRPAWRHAVAVSSIALHSVLSHRRRSIGTSSGSPAEAATSHLRCAGRERLQANRSSRESDEVVSSTSSASPLSSTSSTSCHILPSMDGAGCICRCAESCCSLRVSLCNFPAQFPPITSDRLSAICLAFAAKVRSERQSLKHRPVVDKPRQFLVEERLSTR